MERLAENMTLAEFLAAPYSRATRAEWINGEAWAMSGGTALHAAIGTNILGALINLTRGSGCRVTNSDQMVHVLSTDAYLYPDAIVVCGSFQFSPDHAQALINPSVVVEVLSPSTADYDRGAKFEHYRRLESLRDYVIVDPSERLVTHHHRQEGGWFRRDLLEGELALLDGALTLPVAEVFADLDVLS